MSKLILASGSPRRKELLEMLKVPFAVKPANIDETIEENQPPEEIVKDLAIRKAAIVAQEQPSDFVIGSDTIVVCDSKIMGKPDNYLHAQEMLSLLSGKVHTVYTGVAITSPNGSEAFCVATTVEFWPLAKGLMTTYLDSGEPFDKAGAYGIQGRGSLFVKEIKGDYYAVMGLPVSHLYRSLERLDFFACP